MKSGKKIYSSEGNKYGTCPKCGHRNGLNPFRFDGISHTTYRITGHKVIHHKCKKCLWQGYILVNSNSRVVNTVTHFAFYAFWIIVTIGLPTLIFLSLI